MGNCAGCFQASFSLQSNYTTLSICCKLQEYKNALETQALQEDKAQDQLQKDNQNLLQKIQVSESFCPKTLSGFLYTMNLNLVPSTHFSFGQHQEYGLWPSLIYSIFRVLISDYQPIIFKRK